MPKYIPNALFSDCYASVGNITFFHKDGECFFKTKARPAFPGTAGQQVQLSIHQRGIREWKNLDHNEQLEWNALAKSVKSKRLPAEPSCHISGYNLFMSAYHGLACIGDERVPEPQPLPAFPIVCLDLTSATLINNIDLQLTFRITTGYISDTLIIIAKIQLSAPALSSHKGKLRNYIGTRTNDDHVSFIIPDYRTVSGLDLKEYQVHARYLLIDSKSGHRSIEQILSVRISI